MNHISKIIVIGANHHNTLSVVRSFGEEGIKVILFIYGSSESYIASSKYIDTVYFYSTASEAIDSLLRFVPKKGTKDVVIACSDEISSLMDIRYDELISKFDFFNAGKAGRVTYFMDKVRQVELANKCGFVVPISTNAFPQDINPYIIKYPCFIKPKESIHGGKKISICQTPEDLKTSISKYDPNYEILIQNYINKDYEIVILGMTMNSRHYIPGFIQKHREEKGGTTYCTVKPISQLDRTVVDACEQLIKAIDYQGLWGIECIKKGDEYYFIELNLRNDATTYAMKTAGVNLLYLYYCLLGNIEYYYKGQNVSTINSIVEFNDFNFVLKGKVNIIKWLKQYYKSECKYFYSSLDIEPYKRKKRDYILFLRKRILKF